MPSILKQPNKVFTREGQMQILNLRPEDAGKECPGCKSVIIVGSLGMLCGCEGRIIQDGKARKEAYSRTNRYRKIKRSKNAGTDKRN